MSERPEGRARAGPERPAAQQQERKATSERPEGRARAGPERPAAQQQEPEATGERPPHDAPGAIELVEAVREFLEGDVTDATEGRVRFHARVAARVLAIVERELASADQMAADHAARLAALGFASDAELAAAIRSGACDDRWDEVSAAVRATVADKLAVANPGYA